MPGLDQERALSELRTFYSLLAVRWSKPGPGFVGPGSWLLEAPGDEVQGAAQFVEPILDRVVRGWRKPTWTFDPRIPWDLHRTTTVRAIAQLERQEEQAAILGDDAPELSAARLHPWIWDGARSLWSSGHFLDAVGAAAKVLNAHAQTKLGRRDAGEWRLLADAFSTKPPQAGHPRLRLMEADGSDTFANVHEGAAFYAQGVFRAIRNPASHEVDELDEVVALEQLAAFSVLARWVDSAEVVTT